LSSTTSAKRELRYSILVLNRRLPSNFFFDCVL